MKNILITQSLYQDFRNNLYSKLYYDWNKYSQKNNFNLWPISHDVSINSLKNIKYCIKNLKDLFHRNIKYKKVKIDNTFPKYILENKKKFSSWII